ncbi:MscL-domain-containing protein [Gonapodya prolifera JEL478]|uniref:MscL-domain-containing protein n=1 Tax=Gonapodya prolifera (strain JEL478) TaxID=1344416 RepID=A0A139A519_GONPJ|nr:MscL-domain-containing protein [Gonapodya prolifera JEL478]|eukprot:KXS11831.1 MscL-domain-containing protein [Gonapodya prolifera JEL478]
MSSAAAAKPNEQIILLEETGAKAKQLGKKALNVTGGLANDFKNFIMRGNVVDLAIAVIMGAAFTTVVNSLVTDIFTPFIGLAAGQSSLPDSFVVLRNGQNRTSYGSLVQAKSDGAVNGNFINNIIYFLIVSGIMFLVFKGVTTVYHPPAPKDSCPDCLEDYKIGAKVCPHCRKDLTTVEHK